MKELYIAPVLEITVFLPVERLASELEEPYQLDIRRLTDLAMIRSAGDSTISQEGDIFLPLW